MAEAYAGRNRRKTIRRTRLELLKPENCMTFFLYTGWHRAVGGFDERERKERRNTKP